jgi:hypothetical protein
MSKSTWNCVECVRDLRSLNVERRVFDTLALKLWSKRSYACNLLRQELRVSLRGEEWLDAEEMVSFISANSKS